MPKTPIIRINTRKYGRQNPDWWILGADDKTPPSDAIILFDGSNLDAWVSTLKDGTIQWKNENGILNGSAQNR